VDLRQSCKELDKALSKLLPLLSAGEWQKAVSRP
jgi:hypothetical protein